ncbi:hypothetical protein BKA62DRAFT_671684 [Auriculariales sp. MPI-PUGE-AT-0066]|nr:hypothetical protein BKA62DRAFT_671684 [Auriculariales sp. MPI-PUGE-AT-0066]
MSYAVDHHSHPAGARANCNGGKSDMKAATIYYHYRVAISQTAKDKLTDLKDRFKEGSILPGRAGSSDCIISDQSEQMMASTRLEQNQLREQAQHELERRRQERANPALEVAMSPVDATSKATRRPAAIPDLRSLASYVGRASDVSTLVNYFDIRGKKETT